MLKRTSHSPTLKFLFLVIYISFVAEVGLRSISYFINVYDIEMLKYAKKLKIISKNSNLSHEHIPNSEAKLMGVNIELNSLGHRNKDILEKKSKDEYRIHIIVKKEKIFPSILEKKLNQNEFIKESYDSIKVINAGIGNTNTLHHYYLFKNQYMLTKPDTLVLQYFITLALEKNEDSRNQKYRYFY